MGGNFGFIHEKIEIKILILFILRRLPEPITFEVLTELTMCDDGISYFDFTECVADLVRTGHVRFSDGRYSLTSKGARNGEITENSLPFSVRHYVENSTYAYRNMQSRNAMIETIHKVNPDGSCTVTLSLSDGVGDIVTLDMYTSNEKQAFAMERGFRKNAESIYNTLIKMLLNK
jgi:hypothetical protein